MLERKSRSSRSGAAAADGERLTAASAGMMQSSGMRDRAGVAVQFELPEGRSGTGADEERRESMDCIPVKVAHSHC
jgi:hypothetical protein